MTDLYNAARVGDAFVAGAILTGSEDVEINGYPAAFVSSIAVCALHPSAQAVVTGSDSVTINNNAAAFVGSLTSCGGLVVTGSDDVLIGS